MPPLRHTGADSRTYTLGGRLGAGGHGTVYLARMTLGLGTRQVAVKVLHSSAQLSVARMLDEGRVGLRLDHPGIVPVLDMIPMDDQTMGLVSAYVAGADLGRLCMPRQGRVDLPPSAALDVATEVALALAHAHEHRVVHRDVKPGNILISRAGIAQLIDFGIASFGDQWSRTRTGTLPGTIAYFSPEHATGVVGPASDVFALGIVLYELLTGQHYLLRHMGAYLLVSDRAAYLAHHAERLARIEDPDLRDLLAAVLAFDPDARPSALALARTLARMERSGPSLRAWALDHNWPAQATSPGHLTGRRFGVGLRFDVADTGDLVLADAPTTDQPVGTPDLSVPLEGTTWFRDERPDALATARSHPATWQAAAVAGLLTLASVAVLVGSLLCGVGAWTGRPAAAASADQQVRIVPRSAPPPPVHDLLPAPSPRVPALHSDPPESHPIQTVSVAGDVARASEPTPSKTPEPPRSVPDGRLEAVGPLHTIRLVDETGRTFAPGDRVPPGTYAVHADFGAGIEPAHPPDFPASEGSGVVVHAGEPTRIRCSALLRRCDPVRP